MGTRYPYMLTKECLALTFPLKMEVPLRNADRDMQPTPDHGVASGFSLAKVNLRSATYGYLNLLFYIGVDSVSLV